MYWEDALSSVGEVRTIVPHQAQRWRSARAAVGKRNWPTIIILAACSALAAAGIALGILPLPVVLLLGLAAYLVASRLPRPLSIPAALTAGAVLGAALWYAAFATTRVSLAGEAIEGFLPLAAGWFVGDAVAARRRYLAGLAEQADRERAAEAERARQQVRDERVRIARELHDMVAHALAVVTVQAGVGRRLMTTRPEEAANALESIEAIGRTAQEELRVVLGLLREEGIGDTELSPAPRLADLKALAETVRASGTPVELRIPDTSVRLSPAMELTVYRVVQEALTNVVKHAPKARATVDVAVCSANLRIEIADDGTSARHHAGPEFVPGHGIAGMRERISAFGGSLVAGPCPDGGFRVLAEFPAEPAP
jgi:signal transduction histidine kinase